MTMIDFHGYLLTNLSEVLCVTPVRESSITDQFFIVNFRGGSNQSFPGEHRDEFVRLVKNAMLDQVMRQSVK